MSKTKRTSRQQKAAKEVNSKFNFDEFLPQKYHVPAVILVIVVLFLIFLNPLYFGGKTFQSGDIIAMESVKPYIAKDREGFSLWNPYIFCGMPAYALSTEFAWFNLIASAFTVVRDAFSAFFAVDYAKWSFYLILMGITSFLFMRHITKNTLVSLFTAVATSFSTGLIVFLFIGHVTKLTSLCMYPLIFLMLFRMKEKIRFLDIMILIIALQLFIQGFHVQIIFYTLFAVAIFFIYYFLRSIKLKDALLRNNLIKTAAIFIGSSVIAVAIQSDNLTQIYEYSQYSTRGTKSIVEETNPAQGQSDSEYYEYHTNWSFSPGEVMTFIIPSYFGFGNSTYSGPLTQGNEVEVNTYFGQMPFVDVAMYMGVLIFFLALFAIITRWKDPLVRFLTILSGIALLISFGKNFPILFDLMFYYFPYFDKFRVPSMMLVLVQMSFPVLAGLGLMKIISLRTERDPKLINAIKITAFVFTGIFIFSLLLNSAIKDWFIERVNNYAASVQSANPQLAQQFNALAEYSAGMFTTDLIMAFAFCAVLFWMAYSYINSKISADLLVVGAIVLTLVDLWRIDARGAKYIDNPDPKEYFKQPDYISIIKDQNDKDPYRIINIKQDGSLGSLRNNGNFNAYFLVEDFYGYSGIKPRTYQDFMDIVGPVNPSLWRMLNVKYVVTDQPVQFPGFKQISNTGQSIVYENQNALPRIYFVNRVEKKDNLEFLNMVKAEGFDPREISYVHNESLSVDAPDSTALVQITKYTDEKIEADIKSTGNNFLFFGDTYVPTGWNAYVDGEETKIHQTNHGYMGIVVPRGNHKIIFEYAPASFFVAKNTALILSALVLLGLIAGIYLELNRKKRPENP